MNFVHSKFICVNFDALRVICALADTGATQASNEVKQMFNLNAITAGTYVTAHRNLAGFVKYPRAVVLGGPGVVAAVSELVTACSRGKGTPVTWTELREDVSCACGCLCS